MRQVKEMAYVYIVKCSDGTLYTGITKDIQKRMKTHLSGGRDGAKYTKSHKIEQLLTLWYCEEYNHAAKLEYAVKKTLTRAEKLALVENPHLLYEVFPKLSLYEYTLIPSVTLEDCIEGRVISPCNRDG